MFIVKVWNIPGMDSRDLRSLGNRIKSEVFSSTDQAFEPDVVLFPPDRLGWEFNHTIFVEAFGFFSEAQSGLSSEGWERIDAGIRRQLHEDFPDADVKFYYIAP